MPPLNYLKKFRHLKWQKGKRRIGLLGGSFNPAHDGHRTASILAMRQFFLHEIWWLVVEQNPHKKTISTPIGERALLAKKTARHPKIKIKTLDGKKNIYSYDAIKQIIKQHPKKKFLFIMGSDCWFQFHHWHRYRDMAKLLPLVMINRAPHHHLYRRAPADRVIKNKRRFTHPLNHLSSSGRGWLKNMK
ncbi:MAG: hypothetical protein ACR2NY_05405 [Alphaproteobacteria bacterium]